MSGLEKIQIVYCDSKFKNLQEVFKKLSKERSLGIYKEGDYYSVGTSFMFRKVDSEDKLKFNNIQKESKEKGVVRNIFSFKI